jgi:hypothetical protein
MAEDRGCQLSDLSPDDLRTIHPMFSDDVSLVRGGLYAIHATKASVGEVAMGTCLWG